jgi:hypothetical protein
MMYGFLCSEVNSSDCMSSHHGVNSSDCKNSHSDVNSSDCMNSHKDMNSSEYMNSHNNNNGMNSSDYENSYVPHCVFVPDKELDGLAYSHVKLNTLDDTQECFSASHHKIAFDDVEDTVS